MEWIYIEDGLPEPGDVVLAWSLIEDIAVIAGYDPENDSPWTLEDGFATPTEVSAWMPLPDRPASR